MSSTPNPHLALADAAEQRANAATPGPWEQRSDGWTVRSLDSPCRRVCITYFTTTIESEVKQQVDDADFIAHARQDVPALAAAVREQAATIAALEGYRHVIDQWLICDNQEGATGDAQADFKRMVTQIIRQQLDPNISEEAADLRDTYLPDVKHLKKEIAALQTSLTASERRECAYRAHLEELGYTGAVEEGVYTRCKPSSPMRSRWRRRGG